MSNNIYDILKKMQNLEAPKQSLTESKKAKPDYIDIDKDGNKTEPMKKAAREKSKGAVAEAVATVERQLAEKYQGFKKSVAEGVQAKGTIKPTDSGEEYTAAPGYRVKAEYEPGQSKPKMGFVKDKSSEPEQTGQGAKPAKPADQPKVDEDALDFLRDPEGIAKNRAAQAASDQRFADRSAKHFAGQVGDQYHDQLIKTNPAYRDEYMSQVRDVRSPDVMRKIEKELQAKYDPMGGPTNIDYEKIKKNPMSTRAGEQGVDWRPFGPGPRDSFDSDKFGRPVKEGDIDESALQAYLGKKKYGEQGMKALQQAGRDGASKEKMARIRAQHDKMDEDIIGVREVEMTEAVEAFTPEDIEAAINYRNPAGPIWQIKNGKIRFYLMNMDRMALDDMLSRPLASQQDWDMLKKQIKKQLQDSQGTIDEDMLSPGQKKIAKMSPPPNKIDANDLAALRAGKKKKSEGNAFSGAVAKAKATGQDEFKVGGKKYKVQEGESQYMNKDGTFKNPRTDAARERQRAEIEQTQKTSDGNWMGPKDKAPKYRPSEYTQGKYSQEIAKAMDQDREERDAARGPLNKIANYGSRLVFGKDMPVDKGRTSMREGWEEMQKYLEKKRGPESKGGAGKKAGTRYGGSAQRDDDDETDGEGQAVVKKKGRPKGTGGGAKFNFKKPKD